MRLSEAAMQYVGVPFRFRGRAKSGVDCSGLLVCAMRESGLDVEDRINYGREPWNDGLEASLDEHFHIADFPLQVDDVVLMSLNGRGVPQHIGIIADYPGGLGIIHARSEFGKVLFHHMDPKHVKSVLKVYRGRR